MTEDELLDLVVVSPTGCWIWAGSDSGPRLAGPRGRGRGYGKIKRGGVTHYVHVWVYKKLRGRIPRGYRIDHVCSSWTHDAFLHRRCVRLDHLQAVTERENQRRRVRGALLRPRPAAT